MEYTQADVKPHLPPNLHVTTGREPRHNTRWRLFAWRVCETYHMSKQFGGRLSEIDAVRYIISVAWQIAKREHGIECPHRELAAFCIDRLL